MDQKEITSLIDEKEELFKQINKESEDLIEAKSSEAYHEQDLWNNTIWEDVLNGRITDSLKKAYVKGELRISKEKVEYIQLRIDMYYREIRIIDDKLKYLGGFDD